MTASVVNKQLNNLEEIFSAVKESAERSDVAFNKTAKDFEKVFDKSVQKIQNTEENNNTNKVSNNETKNIDIEQVGNDIIKKLNNLQNTDNAEKNSKDVIEDIKKIIEQCSDIDLKGILKEKISTALADTEITEQWVEFREVLSEIVSEANVETSLDLTLAKDINEIISQLKEAVEKTTESLETVEKTLQPTVDLNQTEDANTSDLNIVVDNSSDSETAATEEESKKDNTDTQQNLATVIPFEQVLTLYDKTVKSEIINNQSAIETESNSYNIENEQSKIIEFAENIVDEIITDKNTEKVASNDLESLLDEDLLKELKIENIQAETDASGNETFMQRETPEEVAVKNIINKEIEVFDLKFDKTVSAQTIQPAQIKTVDTNPSRIIDQITKQFEALQSGSKVNIVLNPESLGKVNIQLLTTKEGLMAQLTVTTQEAKDILMKGLDGLKDSLISQGVGVDNVSVKVADSQKSEYNQDWTEQEGSRGGNKEQRNPDKNEKEKGAFEKMMAQTLKQENGNV